jgi:beta-glucanase (GH16 family)
MASADGRHSSAGGTGRRGAGSRSGPLLLGVGLVAVLLLLVADLVTRGGGRGAAISEAVASGGTSSPAGTSSSPGQSLPATGGTASEAPGVAHGPLVWSDEFDGADGSAPDPTKWGYDLGGTGWGNKELQYYTDRRANSVVENGALTIRALRESYDGSDGVRSDYTSARLVTRGHLSVTYGTVEARIKLPAGTGFWPAFWMLGDDLPEVGWPRSGELDLLESVGPARRVAATVHGPRVSDPATQWQVTHTVVSPTSFADDFHLYSLEWTPSSLTFSVDGVAHLTVARADLPPDSRWVFDKPFYLVLNLAVGGEQPGPPNAGTPFPGRMTVDWVRVYGAAS